jgi:hypothetical protein
LSDYRDVTNLVTEPSSTEGLSVIDRLHTVMDSLTTIAALEQKARRLLAQYGEELVSQMQLEGSASITAS